MTGFQPVKDEDVDGVNNGSYLLTVGATSVGGRMFVN